MTTTTSSNPNSKSKQADWFALSVLPGQEVRTAQTLLKRVPGIEEVVVPKEVLKKNNRLGQRITVDRLIFPGYAFVRTQLMGEDGGLNNVIYGRVTSTQGVCGFVGTVRSTERDGQITTIIPMTEKEIADIKEYVARNKEEGGRVENALSAGEKIRVTGGSFMGLEGNVNQVDNEHGKAQVVLQVFGRETKVEISTSDLEKMAA